MKKNKTIWTVIVTHDDFDTPTHTDIYNYDNQEKAENKFMELYNKRKNQTEDPNDPAYGSELLRKSNRYTCFVENWFHETCQIYENQIM